MSAHIIDRSSTETVYSQISRSLEHEIKSLHSPGKYLSSEQELASRFSVNRHTIRRAIDELVNAGLVERCHGKGTIILEPAFDYSIGENSRFTESLESRGKTTDSKVLRKLIVPANGGVSRRLGISDGDPVIWIETLRQVDHIPFCIISHFIPQKKFESIEIDYNGGSLHRFIRERLDLRLRRTDSLITAVLPQGDDALHLSMPHQMPVLRVKSLNVDLHTNLPVEYAITRFRSDRIQLAVNL